MANTKTVIGVFSSEGNAEKAVHTLRQSGFSDNEISVVGPDRGKGQHHGGASLTNQHLGDGATWGAGIGGAAGLLASAGALAIPGFGPILAMGPLAATLTGVAGGGLAGGLVDFGIPEQQSREYERKVKEGKFLAVLKTSGDADRAAQCLRDEGASDVRID
jgi:uncharacterized membrane protein